MADINLALTAAGQALMAKIALGNGAIPLEITRIATSSLPSPDPLNSTALAAEEQTLTVTSSTTDGARTTISAYLNNFGNPELGIPALAQGYNLAQIGFYATDPDDGEILMRISQFENPNYVPAATERAWEYEPTFNIITGNASTVIINIDPAGLITQDQLNAAIAEHDNSEAAHTNIWVAIDNIVNSIPNDHYTKAQTDQRIGEGVHTHNNALDTHPDIRALLYDHESRITLLELIGGGGISANLFSVTFTSLDGLTVTGVWNRPMGRIEF